MTSTADHLFGGTTPGKSSPKPITITLPPALLAEDRGDYEGITTFPAAECGGCEQLIHDGDPLRKVGNAWMREQCAVRAVTSADVDAAWLLLADQITQRPSAFRASDIRAVLSNVARIARRGGAV